MTPAPLLLCPPARADVSVPTPPPRGTVASDLPPPAAPESGPSAAVLGGASVLLGLSLLAGLWRRRRAQNQGSQSTGS